MRWVGGAPRSVVPWAGALVVVATIWLSTAAAGTSTAPDFALTDIYGNPLHLSDFRGKIVLLDFMYERCASCELARPVLVDVYNAHRGVFDGISLDILPLTDSDYSLQNYTRSPNTFIPWHVARDTAAVSTAYGVTAVVRLFLVDQNGYVIFDKEGMSPGDETSLRSDLESTIAAAIRGEATRIQLQQLSIYSLAALAAVGSFFSPCSFPMFPGYMAVFLGIDPKNQQVRAPRMSAVYGVISSFGIILVYGIIWAALLAIGVAAAAAVPVLQPAVGVLLIVMGAVMFTAFQFNFLVNPFRTLRRRLLPNWTPNAVQSTSGKLFLYGVGYGAAGFGCVAPPFIAAVLNGTILGGPIGGLFVFLVYAVIVIAIMIAVTLVLATLGQTALKKMNRYTEVIKKISAAVLIVAGAYLIYYWYSAWVAA